MKKLFVDPVIASKMRVELVKIRSHHNRHSDISFGKMDQVKALQAVFSAEKQKIFVRSDIMLSHRDIISGFFIAGLAGPAINMD